MQKTRVISEKCPLSYKYISRESAARHTGEAQFVQAHGRIVRRDYSCEPQKRRPVRPLTEDSSVVNKQAAICLSSSFTSFVILSIRGHEKREGESGGGQAADESELI